MTIEKSVGRLPRRPVTVARSELRRGFRLHAFAAICAFKPLRVFVKHLVDLSVGDVQAIGSP